MRCILGVVVLIVGTGLAAGAASAVTPATLVVTPNPVAAGADVTITNASDAASLCEGGGDVDVFITYPDGSMSTPLPGPSPDVDGNWQYITQLAEPGEYVVIATCNTVAPPSAAEQDGPFRYAPVDLTVTEANPLPGPSDLPSVVVPDPQSLRPAFTG